MPNNSDLDNMMIKKYLKELKIHGLYQQTTQFFQQFNRKNSIQNTFLQIFLECMQVRTTHAKITSVGLGEAANVTMSQRMQGNIGTIRCQIQILKHENGSLYPQLNGFFESNITRFLNNTDNIYIFFIYITRHSILTFQ